MEAEKTARQTDYKKLVINSVCWFTQTSHWPVHVSAQMWKSPEFNPFGTA